MSTLFFVGFFLSSCVDVVMRCFPVLFNSYRGLALCGKCVVCRNGWVGLV
jgi:hypothetical protein